VIRGQSTMKLPGFIRAKPTYSAGRKAMPTYINLMTYTDRGLRNIKKSPGRLDVARKAAEDLGGKLGDLYLTMGAYDLVAISEFPDDATAATFALKIGALGNVRTTTVKAFPENAYRKIVEAV
jgi:uncharacterized protein with GYD domain